MSSHFNNFGTISEMANLNTSITLFDSSSIFWIKYLGFVLALQCIDIDDKETAFPCACIIFVMIEAIDDLICDFLWFI